MKKGAPPFGDDDENEDWGELSKWGNEHVRPTDPETAHDAAAKLDKNNKKRRDLREAYQYFCGMIAEGWDGVTNSEFKHALMADGRNDRRADSLRRRLGDLLKQGLLEIRYDKQPDGTWKLRKRGDQQIHYLVDGASKNLPAGEP